MQFLSPLQRLPLHVVQLTVDHVTGSSRLVFDGIHINSQEYRALLKPLLEVCSNFRSVACPRYYSSFELNVSKRSLDYLSQRYSQIPLAGVNYRTLNYPGYCMPRLAKDVTVFLAEQAVYSGEALEIVSCAPYNGCAFPLARVLTFVFVDGVEGRMDNDIGTDSIRAKATIDGFVGRIQQMAPLANKIRVKLAFHNDASSVTSRHFDYLVSRLYQLSCCIGYGFGLEDDDPVQLHLGMISNLSQIAYTSESETGSIGQFVQLARMSASTLQSLNLQCEHGIDVLGLVQDSDGNCITFPHLLSLKLHAAFHSNNPARPVFHGAAPFPVLRKLHADLECPFGDDTFFRGNAATLEHLYLQLDTVSATMLCRHKVFVLGSHPRLQSVRIWYTDNFGLGLFALSADAMQFLYSIGSGAAVREYARYGPLQDQVPMFSLLDGYACIQVLSLPSLRPNLWYVILLLKSLPLLSDLHTSLPSIGPVPVDIAFDTLPGYAISNYEPASKRLRCWHLDKGHIPNLQELATCVLLLALVCPNFDYAVPPASQRQLFMREMETSISSDPYKPYAPRLRRLLFNGWKG
ncbi:hypothetical protein IW152_002971 [Coemansia sp. BCRC 34962]|nr:hypothetical protein IW152_002971 [Coemansia sp. BCRC 34962]